MKGTEPEVLDEMVRRLVAEFQPEQIILFGSRAWGEPDEDSDVDLLVIVSHSDQTPIERAQQAYRCLGDARVPTDILVKTRAEAERFRHVRASLEHKIFEEGKVLYG
ncbi:MAG TPA: nucleotidyltransferase domain-containing protein [Thermoguttaceae bacterium]|nr:nucleotidyltransferase domain-containing protein [Thermoguttaceae bacterium]